MLGLGYVLGLCMPTLYASMSYVVATVDDMVTLLQNATNFSVTLKHAYSLACQDRGGMCQVFAAVESKEG